MSAKTRTSARCCSLFFFDDDLDVRGAIRRGGHVIQSIIVGARFLPHIDNRTVVLHVIFFESSIDSVSSSSPHCQKAVEIVFRHVEMPSPAVPSSWMSCLHWSFGDGVRDGPLFQACSVILLSVPLRNDFYNQLTVENGHEVGWIRTEVVTPPSDSDPLLRHHFWVTRPRSKPTKILRSIS